MASPTSFPGDIVVPGNARIGGSITPLKPKDSVLAISQLQEFTIPMTWWRTFDAMGTNLPDAAADDDLGLVGGTHGTAHPTLQAGDVGEASSARKARALIPVPWNYVAANSITLRFYAGCLTAAADTTCTLDCAIYLCDDDSTVHGDGDLAPAAVANNMNDTAFANCDFALSTTTNISPGDQLDVLLTITYVDAATAVVTPCVGLVQLLCDVR